jgi:hypothetical protein
MLTRRLHFTLTTRQGFAGFRGRQTLTIAGDLAGCLQFFQFR